MTFSKTTTPLHPLQVHSTHSTYLFKIFFSRLTLSTAFLQKASGQGKNHDKVIDILRLIFDKTSAITEGINYNCIMFTVYTYKAWYYFLRILYYAHRGGYISLL